MRWIVMIAAIMGLNAAYALQPGDAVPDIKLPSTTGGELSLHDLQGKWVVLYFYPRAFTPGCTAQSCSLRDEFGDIQARGAIIIGASLDSPERQKAFKKEHALPFELVSDVDKELARAFDSLMVGGLVAARKTFIIDPEGKVAYRFDRPKTANHADEVIAKLDELMAIQ